MASAENLISLLRAFDDEAYSVLANKGLLRRAKKEITKGCEISAQIVDQDRVIVQIAEYEVAIDDKGPSQASCTCPATACCQHILIACIKIPELFSSENLTDDPAEHSLDLPSEEEVKKWAGAETFRKALHLVSSDVCLIEENCITFTGDIETRILPGGLDAAITNAQPKQKKTYLTAGFLCLLKENGEELVLAKKEQQKELDLYLLEIVKDLLVEMVELGLNHLSQSIQMRLSSLSVQCRVCKLIRPSLELESCAEEVRLMIARHATADQIRLFNKSASLYALCESILKQGMNVDSCYVGQARSTYTTQGKLNLVGVGAYPWETESGYIGLTTLFWAPEEECFFSCGESRPKHSTAGFSPMQRYEQESHWKGGGGLKALLTSSFTLENAKGNSQRRLSIHEQSIVTNKRPYTLDQLPPVIQEWNELQGEHTMGLKRAMPLDALHLVAPKSWGKLSFDEINQELIIPLKDTQDDLIPLILPFMDLTSSGVFYLEKLKNIDQYNLLTLYRKIPQPHFFPISLIHRESGEQHNIFFQPKKNALEFKKRLLSKFKFLVPLPDDSQVVTSSLEQQSNLSLCMTPYMTHLETCAETGKIFPGNPSEQSPSLDSIGLTVLHRQFNSLNNGENLLKLRYIMDTLNSSN